MDCTCTYKHHFKTKAFNLIYNKNGCPVCSGLKVNIGVNDMWTTNPQLASLLANPEDGYKYTQCSDKKVWWKCPCCGEFLFKNISNVNKKGLSCNKCSDGISFPNRFMYNILTTLEVLFESEYIIDGANYRYDFYIPKYNLIIEMQGRQHYDGWNSKRKTKEEIQQNDIDKRNYALKNGITQYLEIDCREANKNYIKKSILNSELVDYFDFKEFDWDKCCIDSVKSFVGVSANYYNDGLTSTQIAEKLGFATCTIIRWLKIATELNLCNWIPSNGFLNEEKPVILMNTGKIYNSISMASREIGQCVQNIYEACCGKRNYCGVQNNEPLVWMFLEDYKNGDIPNKSVDDVYLTHHHGICVNRYTMDGIYIDTFDSINNAEKSTQISTIKNACSKKVYSAGDYRWYYIDDKNQPDKSKIQGIPRDYGEDRKYTQTGTKTKHLLANPDNEVYLDCYDRYGNFISTYIGYNLASVKTDISKDQIYKCCAGKSAYAGNFVFRYSGESFYKYFYPNAFSEYINVYEKDTQNFVGMYYSLQEATRQLNLSGTSSAYKALRKERKYAYGYCFYYANDPTQPDKTKIISNEIIKEVS